MFAGIGTTDFAWRCRILRRLHLLDPNRPAEVAKYIDEAYFTHDLVQSLMPVLQRVGIDGYIRIEEMMERYVQSHRWPGWVAQTLDEPLANAILKAIDDAGGIVPLVELCGRIQGRKPEQVRSVVDQLIARLVLFEDLNRETWDIMVGYLPAVREKLAQAARPRQRPPLVVCEQPKEIAPQGSPFINDLRAVLLEIANAPPRLRTDGELFQREIDRFSAALDPLPDWLLDALKWTVYQRIAQALEWATLMKFVKSLAVQRKSRLELTSRGDHWLSRELAQQYVEFVEFLREQPVRGDLRQSDGSSYPSHERLHDRVPWGDARFFGQSVAVYNFDKSEHAARYLGSSSELVSLRPLLDQAFAALSPGAFYSLDSVIAHIVFKQHNPLNAGQPPARTVVSWAGKTVIAFEEEREQAGSELIKTFVKSRLIPLGCMRAAIDESGGFFISREPCCDLYFGARSIWLLWQAPSINPDVLSSSLTSVSS